MGNILISHGNLHRPDVLMLCFPHAGGNAHTYKAWQADLPATVGLIGYQPAGRGSRARESPASDLVSMVAEVVHALKALPNVPYVFYGHSFGGLLAFEVLKILRKQAGPAVVHFIASASLPPTSVPLRRHRWAHLDDDGAMFDHLVAEGGVRTELIAHRDALLPIMPSIRAEFRILARYEFEAPAPFDIPLMLLHGKHDTLVSADDMAEWKTLFSHGAKEVEIDAGHLFVDQCPQEVTGQLRGIVEGFSAARG